MQTLKDVLRALAILVGGVLVVGLVGAFLFGRSAPPAPPPALPPPVLPTAAASAEAAPSVPSAEDERAALARDLSAALQRQGSPLMANARGVYIDLVGAGCSSATLRRIGGAPT